MSSARFTSERVARPCRDEFVKRGWIAVVPNYRLAPRHPWPVQILDVTRALDRVKRKHRDLRRRRDARRDQWRFGRGQLAALVALKRELTRPGDPTTTRSTDWSVRARRRSTCVWR